MRILVASVLLLGQTLSVWSAPVLSSTVHGLSKRTSFETIVPPSLEQTKRADSIQADDEMVAWPDVYQNKPPATEKREGASQPEDEMVAWPDAYGATKRSETAQTDDEMVAWPGVYQSPPSKRDEASQMDDEMVAWPDVYGATV